ncbi:hypothetical protein ACFOHK_16430 [Falsigemmobacter intermedius]|uniref:hypothetical protein n=1 Tax=Falsigemmobacter intermedius TaxID=1553448 RepID=UPI003607DD7A
MGFKTEINSSLSLRYFGQSGDIGFPNTAPKSTLNAHESDYDSPIHGEEDYNADFARLNGHQRPLTITVKP